MHTILVIEEEKLGGISSCVKIAMTNSFVIFAVNTVRH